MNEHVCSTAHEYIDLNYYALLSLALSAILDIFSEYNGENPCQSKV